MWIDLFLLFFLGFTLLLLITVLVNIVSGAPFVPSGRRTIDRMLQAAQFKKGERVYDLGCGDGRLLIRAEKQYGIHGIGYENAPIAYLLGRLNKWIHRSKVDLRFGTLFKANLKDADVLLMYLGPELQKKLMPKIKKECRKGTRLISNTFHLPGMEPTQTLPRDKKAGANTVYLYTR